LLEFVDKLTSFLIALVIHVVLLGLLFISMDIPVEPRAISPQPVVDIVQAVVVDERQIQAELEKIKAIEQEKRDAERRHQAKLAQQAEAARKARQKEQEQLAELKKKQQAERKAAEKRSQQEQQRLAELKQQQAKATDERRREESQLAEIAVRKQRELDATQKAETERKALEAEKRRLEEDKQRRQAELALQDQIAEEQHLAKEEQEREAQRTIDRYTSIIKRRIEDRWRVNNAQKGRSCDLFVRVIPGGEVAEARVVRSSGDANFDRSAENAVFKSSPLPMPTEPGMFERLREIRFTFDPTG